ncbi:MAG: hypothetical protein EZS28_012316 [Streblomastix strix]|uniref:Uncharacterized protein n=1 Tax=Streblomastix strix TaxID=222440 RepID=A0A5J4WB49_9EUKA|nr:MAG: hypothetical protein EZS28_012316 [Streblomastix strix]
MEEEGECRAAHECWKIPDFKSEIFTGLKQAVINKMQKFTPEKANDIKAVFETFESQEEKGKVLLDHSKNLIVRSNNLSEKQIDDLNKEVYIYKSNLLEFENINRLLNPNGFEKKKCYRNKQILLEQESGPQQHLNNQQGKKKKKLNEDDSDEYKMDMIPAKRKRND